MITCSCVSISRAALWSALMLYKKKLVVNASAPMSRTVPAAPNNKIQALIGKYAEPMPPPPPSFLEFGARETCG